MSIPIILHTSYYLLISLKTSLPSAPLSWVLSQSSSPSSASAASSSLVSQQTPSSPTASGSRISMRSLAPPSSSLLLVTRTARSHGPMICKLLPYSYQILTSMLLIIFPNRIDHQDTTNVDSKGIAFTIRSVFIIDPKKTIRTILSYPASTGRNAAEVLRIVDSLQTGDKHR
jgi:hypothetical protein